jgi:hypothetical protein
MPKADNQYMPIYCVINKMKTFFIFLINLIFLSCNTGPGRNETQAQSTHEIINEDGNSIVSRFSPPEGYQRITLDSNSFGIYLRHLPLKAEGTKVQYYDGKTKHNSHVAAAVIDVPVGKKDLQQCADAVIRLRADYLRQAGREDEIVFNFTNGTPASWPKWEDGYRCFVNGNEVDWRKTQDYSDSDANFTAYLETVFMYAGSLSLEKELKPSKITEIMPGDVFIVGGSPGHAVIVVDVAENPEGNRIFMIAQSYMPAQDIHVLINPENNAISPWYMLEEGEVLNTPEWTFPAGSLRRF